MNARVGKSVEMNDVIGMFGEDTFNASGNGLISFLNEVELVVCNGRSLVVEPERTRVGPTLTDVYNRLCYNRCSAYGSF